MRQSSARRSHSLHTALQSLFVYRMKLLRFYTYSLCPQLRYWSTYKNFDTHRDLVTAGCKDTETAQDSLNPAPSPYPYTPQSPDLGGYQNSYTSTNNAAADINYTYRSEGASFGKQITTGAPCEGYGCVLQNSDAYNYFNNQ